MSVTYQNPPDKTAQVISPFFGVVPGYVKIRTPPGGSDRVRTTG